MTAHVYVVVVALVQAGLCGVMIGHFWPNRVVAFLYAALGVVCLYVAASSAYTIAAAAP